MGQDKKYGKVTLEHGSIGEDEPVIVFRGRDRLLPRLLEYYYTMCVYQESGEFHLGLIEASRQEILIWQDAHPELVRTPTSESAKAWLPVEEELPEPLPEMMPAPVDPVEPAEPAEVVPEPEQPALEALPGGKVS